MSTRVLPCAVADVDPPTTAVGVHGTHVRATGSAGPVVQLSSPGSYAKSVGCTAPDAFVPPTTYSVPSTPRRPRRPCAPRAMALASAMTAATSSGWDSS
jgi:hypothetical protein